MTFRLRWGRMLCVAGVVVLVLVAGLAVFVQIQQRILRWRAERLLDDMRELQSHKSTWADAQKIMTRWGEWGSYEGPCTAEECDYSITIMDTIGTFLWKHVERHPFLLTFAKASSFLGEKDGFVVATLRIKNEIVTTSSYRLHVGWLFGRVTAFNDLEPHRFRADRLLHPEYWIGENGGCTGCTKFETGYTPLAGREKMHELSDFNFSCITRLFPCTEEADILPTAWKQYQEEQPSRQAHEEMLEKCNAPLEFYGNDEENIAIADVISRAGQIAPEYGDNWFARVHLVRSLKGKLPWPPDKVLIASESGSGEEIHGWGSMDMLAGMRYIMFGEIQENHATKALVLDSCGVVPYSEQNLSAIQRGIDASLARHIPER